jgi:hypothetical protein
MMVCNVYTNNIHLFVYLKPHTNTNGAIILSTSKRNIKKKEDRNFTQPSDLLTSVLYIKWYFFLLSLIAKKIFNDLLNITNVGEMHNRIRK